MKNVFDRRRLAVCLLPLVAPSLRDLPGNQGWTIRQTGQHSCAMAGTMDSAVEFSGC
jgi:hypothetical protein